MMRGVAASMLCCSAAAQMVSLKGDALPSVPADRALGSMFGEDGTVVMVSQWLAQPQADYFHVPGFDGSEEIVLSPDVAGAPSREASELGKANSAPPNACGRGWAKLEEAGAESMCFMDIPKANLPKNSWGWTNKIQQGDDFRDVAVYIGASQCRGGHFRFNIDVKFDGTTITVDLSNGGRNKLQSAQVYVGHDKLPMTRKGTYTASPGQFAVNVNGKKQDPVLVFEDMDAAETYWFAVHINACPKDVTPPPTCPSTFYAVQYYCQHGPCTEGVNGKLGVLLVADEWEIVKAFGVCFTTEATGEYPHETRVFAKEISEEERLPPSQGDVKYLGFFATGCGERLSSPPPTVKPGPVRSLCKDNCPPGSAGFVGSA